ncbi:MAG: FprA family A-type flavoprotein [Thermoflexales bacterium]|nr:FprA family A-type flavoprotein [Thermoflexales bacterium]
MKARQIREGIYWMGAVDWDRRLFDALIPLPDGTSYNAYLIQGSNKTVLMDSVDPTKADTLLGQLQTVSQVDYVIAHHAEQDHSGAIPLVLARYPQAQVMATPKGIAMLRDHLCIPEERFIAVADGESLSLGDKTLTFIYMPWVHWPETMVTYLAEERILFTCDFFGSHLATSDLYVTDESRVYEAAKRYYAEIMMPFRKIIQRNLDKLANYQVELIAPSHGPIYNRPALILDAYRDWTSETPKNVVVIPYISTHGSTAKMVEYLVAALVEKGITVYQFDLTVTDIGKLAIALVDAATIIIGTPTIHVGPHPAVFYAAHLANALRPKVRYASIVGSYGWHSKVVEQIAGLIPNLKVELLEPVMCQGYPQAADFAALERLATRVAEKHKTLA